MIGHVGNFGKLWPREDMKSDTVFNHLKNTTNYQSKTFSFVVILLLFSQSVTVQANVLNASQPNDLDHLAPRSEVLIQEGILEEETGSSDNRFDEVGQVLDSGKLKDDISPYVYDKNTSKKPLKINENVVQRNVRDISPSSDPVNCVLTKEKLNKLLEILRDVKGPYSVTTSGAEYVTATEEQCNQVIEMGNAFLNLKRTFQQIRSNVTSFAHYKELKRSYQQEVQTVEIKINVIASIANTEESNNVEKFFKKYQLILQEMNKLLVKDEQDPNLYIAYQMRVCTFEITYNEYELAANMCSTFLNTELMERIYSSVYYNNSDNVIHILLFLYELPATVQQRVVAASSIYHEMKINNHFLSTEILMLDNFISETLRLSQIKNTAKNNLTDTLTYLKHAIEPHVRYVIATWSVKIGNGKYRDVLDVIESPFMYITKHLSLLTQLAYNSDSRKTVHVLGFVKESKYLEESGIIYETLFDEMEANDDIYGDQVLQLASQVKDVMDSFEFRLFNYEDRNRFTLIKKRLPVTVRLIFWNQVRIKNVHFGEYLQYDKHSTNFVLSRMRPLNSMSLGHFRFTPTNAEGKSFQICTTNSFCMKGITPDRVQKPNYYYHVNSVDEEAPTSNPWNITMSTIDKQLFIHPFSISSTLYADDGILDQNVRNIYFRYPKPPKGSYTLFELEQC